MQLADAQRKHAAVMDAKEGAEFKAKREETLRKQAERGAVALCKQVGRRAVCSEKAKSKSDTALEKAQAKNARLRQLKSDSIKRAQEAERKSGMMQRIYEKNTALTEHPRSSSIRRSPKQRRWRWRWGTRPGRCRASGSPPQTWRRWWTRKA